MDLPIEELLARVIWGEARNQGLPGMVAVACTIINRVQDDKRRFGATMLNVICRPYAFSCLLENDPNLPKLLNAPGEPISECRIIARLALDDLLNDPTGGATHYHTEAVDPSWAKKEWMIYLKTIGDHKFYREL